MLQGAEEILATKKQDVEESPMISVIVPTFNNQGTIAACLESVIAQSYKPVELVVIDNFSTDFTFRIAARYADIIVQHGHERSEQANFGVSLASGEYILRLDADLVIDEGLLSECVSLIQCGYDAVEVHNSPDPQISWIARARRFEYDLLKGDPRRISARFLRKSVYEAIGGLNSNLIAGEDFDFQNRLNAFGALTGLAVAESVSISEPTALMPMLHKFYKYGKQAVVFSETNRGRPRGQIDFWSIGQKLYIKKWKKYLENPMTSGSFLVYFALKVIAGGFGFLSGKLMSCFRPMGDARHI